jgi:hypothetical protein
MEFEDINASAHDEPWVILSGKLAYFDSEKFDDCIFSNYEIPTENEKIAINKWLYKRDRYLKDLIASTVGHPDNYLILEINKTRNINQYVKKLAFNLCAGKITYGEFARKKAAYESVYDAKASSINKKQQGSAVLARPKERLKQENVARRRERRVQDNYSDTYSLAQSSRDARIAAEQQRLQEEQNRQAQLQAEMDEQLKQAKRDAAIQALNNYVQQEAMQRQQQDMQRQQALQQAQQQFYQQQMLDTQRRMLQQQQLQQFR